MAGLNYLLDTHSLIWFQENNPKIPEQVMNLIQP
jgi:PIN domain nuclease of toxin-antitoxin system